MVTQNEDSVYLSYISDEKLHLWRVSKITHIAEQIDLVNKDGKRMIPENLKSRVTPMNIGYITEYLIDEGFFEFERDGPFIRFNNYQEEGDVTIMHTKVCTTCKETCIINVDQTECILCRKR